MYTDLQYQFLSSHSENRNWYCNQCTYRGQAEAKLESDEHVAAIELNLEVFKVIILQVEVLLTWSQSFVTKAQNMQLLQSSPLIA